MLDAFKWLGPAGGGAGSWFDATNWVQNGLPATRIPNYTTDADDVTIDGSYANGPCQTPNGGGMGVNAECATLKLINSPSLSIDNGESLRVYGGDIDSAMTSGTVTINAGGYLRMGGNFDWYGGTFTGGGSIIAVAMRQNAPSSTALVTQDAQNLGVNLTVGTGTPGGWPTTSVVIQNLNQDLVVGADCVVTISPNGTLTLTQASGNIVCSTGGTDAASVITNDGTINFDTSAAITCDLPLLNSYNGSLKVIQGTLEFTNGSVQNCYSVFQDDSSSSININSGATLKADAGTTIYAGQLTTVGAGRVDLGGNLDVQEGVVAIDPFGNGYGLLSVSGQVALSGGSSLTINIDDNTNQYDWISASGAVTLGGTAELIVKTSNGPATRRYDIIYSVTSITGDFGPKSYFGADYTTRIVNDTIVDVGQDYELTPVPAKVMGLAPNSGPTTGGTTVTISGSGLTGATAVMFGGVAATSFTVNSDSSITAVTPAEAAGTVDVTVTIPSGTSATGSADQFTYLQAPVVMGISPSSGPTTGGTSVTISGSGLTGATAVYFGGTAASNFTVNADGSITAVSPAGSAGTVDVTVETAGGTSATTWADQFTYLVALVVTGVSPSSGPTSGGTSVMIGGSGFTGATAIYFGGTSALWFTVNSDGSITVTSPNSFFTGTVDITVVTAAGTSATSSADQFTYV